MQSNQSPDRNTGDNPSKTTAEQIAELHASMLREFALVDLRIDHLTGKHDFARVADCPSCLRRIA